jgi:ribosomal protein S18 acetylase RimI-like enzyme
MAVELVETTHLDLRHAPAAAALAHLAFEDFYSIFTADRARILPAIAAQFQSETELNRLVAAIDSGELVAIGACYDAAEMAMRQAAGLRLLLEVADDIGAATKGLRGFAAHFSAPGAEDAYISRFAVAREQRGSGVAMDLLDRVERAARARDRRRISLHVRRDNHRGIAFYRKAGYLPGDAGSRGYLLLHKSLG